VFAQTTCIAVRGIFFITTVFEIFGGIRQCFSVGVPKTLVPQSCEDGGEETWRRLREGVEITGGVTSVNFPYRCQILDKKAKTVKFN
jgi:hypothetical protein